MNVNEFFKIADEIAPKALSDEYCACFQGYDNSGILVDCGEEVRGVLFSLDLSFAAIEKALQTGANLIVTHHPAIYGKIGEICVSDFQPLSEKLIKCIKNGISVISMHLNLDAAQGGIDECLMDGIVLSAENIAGAGTRSNGVSIMHPLENGGYGRAYEVPCVTLGALANEMKNTFSTNRIQIYGEENGKIEKVASFCGGGADEDAVEFAVKNGAEVIVSSDFKHHVLTLAIERGLAVIALTHYASEAYGFEKYYKKIRRQTEIPCGYHTDKCLL